MHKKLHVRYLYAIFATHATELIASFNLVRLIRLIKLKQINRGSDFFLHSVVITFSTFEESVSSLI